MNNKKLIKSVFIYYVSAWQIFYISFLTDFSIPVQNNIPDSVFKIGNTFQKITFILKNNETKVPENLKSFSSQNYFFIKDIKLKCVNEIVAFIDTINFRYENTGLFNKVNPRGPPSLLS